jgi:hypothetical protein
MDLDWRSAGVGKEHGLEFCINPHAHTINELSNGALGMYRGEKSRPRAE